MSANTALHWDLITSFMYMHSCEQECMQGMNLNGINCTGSGFACVVEHEVAACSHSFSYCQVNPILSQGIYESWPVQLFHHLPTRVSQHQLHTWIQLSQTWTLIWIWYRKQGRIIANLNPSPLSDLLHFFKHAYPTRINAANSCKNWTRQVIVSVVRFPFLKGVDDEYIAELINKWSNYLPSGE